MCGIAGVVGPLPDRERVVRQMTAALAHRGPDDEGTFTDDGVALGFRRLAILDLSAAGHQPMAGDRAHIVFNGEIYNFAELRAELSGLRSRSDTEVLLRLWEKEGDACLRRLRGMFALAIWDPAARRLLLARDHFGQKPLFWARVGEAVLFASEMKALLPHVPRDVDPQGVDAFLALQVVPAPLSCWRAIRRLPPATAMSIGPGGETRSWRYWTPPPPGPPPADPEAVIDAELTRAVREQLVADVPVGLFLSGGIDSSLILAAAGRPLDTFTVGFREPAFDESAHAAAVARALGAPNEAITISADDVRDPARLIALYDEPFADVAALPVVALARAARPRVKVVLTGDGGDEVFGGYTHHVVGRWLRRLGVPWRPAVARLRGNIRPAERRALYQPDFLQQVGASPYVLLEPERLTGAAADPVLADRFLYKTDIATMSAGLEARSPFLDVRLVEAAAALPPSALVRGRRGKHLLRRLAERRLGPAAWRRKTGLSMPIAAWLRGELYPLLADLLLAPNARARAYVRPDLVARRIDEHRRGVADHRRALWSLLLLELWLRR